MEFREAMEETPSNQSDSGYSGGVHPHRRQASFLCERQNDASLALYGKIMSAKHVYPSAIRRMHRSLVGVRVPETAAGSIESSAKRILPLT